MILTSTLSLDDAARQWDVVVVGAGPAGSVAARQLAGQGLEVLLVDRATFPRAKVCGCCLNGAALGTLAELGLGELPGRCRAVLLSRVRLAAGGRSAELTLPAGVALSREAFDSALIREALAAGARFLPGTRVTRSRTEPTTLHLAGAREGVARAQVVIVADGLNGQLALERPEVAFGSRIGAGVIAEHAPRDYQPGVIYMAVGHGGYVGLVRLEDGRLDLAAAFDPGFVRRAGGLAPSARAILGEAGLPEVPGLEHLPWRGTPPLTRTARRVVGEHWFAVGDAAGYVEPFTGEGMAWAVASAAAVAPVAARAVTRWDEALAHEWEDTHARLIRDRQTVCRVAARVLRSPWLCGLAIRLLSVAPVLANPVVTALNRPARYAVALS